MNKHGPVQCGLNMNHLAHNTNVWPGPITISTPVVKGLTQKFEDTSLALNEIVYIPSFCLFVLWSSPLIGNGCGILMKYSIHSFVLMSYAVKKSSQVQLT